MNRPTRAGSGLDVPQNARGFDEKGRRAKPGKQQSQYPQTGLAPGARGGRIFGHEPITSGFASRSSRGDRADAMIRGTESQFAVCPTWKLQQARVSWTEINGLPPLRSIYRLARIVLVILRILFVFIADSVMSLLHKKNVIRTNAERVARPTILEVVSECDARADLTAASDIRFGLGGVFDAHLARMGDSCPPIVGHDDIHWITGDGVSLQADLASLFAQVQLDIVHTHRADDLAVVGAAAREAGVPSLVHTICGEIATADSQKIKRLKELADMYGAVLVAPSLKAARRLNDVEGIVIVPRSVDCARYQPGSPAKARQKTGLPEEPRVIGCASPASKLESLFHAVTRLEPDVHIALFGPASPGALERSLIRELDLEERVHVLGGWALPELIHQAIDIYYHGPSDDCSPRPVLAAQACGKPVVAESPTKAKFLCPQTGYLLPAQFRPGLVDALNQALSISPTLTARSFVEKNWNLSSSIGTYESVLRAAVQSGLGEQESGNDAAAGTAG
jgi:glycosyltransferase involved in cell wall biosynthesis